MSTSHRTAHQPPKRLVSVTELRRRLGQRQYEPVDVILADHTVISSRTTAEPVTGELVVSSIERGVSVTGSITFAWEGDCRRCLEVTGARTTVDIDEIFQVNAPSDTEIIDFDGDHVDLIPVVFDAVALSLPLAPLCRPDCAGPDPDRYPAQTEEEVEAARRAKPDPRWAALGELDLDAGND